MNNERNIRKTVLPSGLIVLTERMEHVRSVAMGVWMRAGSRHEVPELNGISHFVEHMVFKGTKSRSAQRIAREVDAIGGNLDAFTGKETVCFNVKVLDEHVPTALDVLSDLVLNPVFATEEIARERGVILEEMKMDEDNPDTLVHEIFTQSFWKDTRWGSRSWERGRRCAASSRTRWCTFSSSDSWLGTWCFPPPAIWSTTALWSW